MADWKRVATSWTTLGSRAGIVSVHEQREVRVPDRAISALVPPYMGESDRACVANVIIPPDGGPYEWSALYRIGWHERGTAATVSGARRQAMRACGRVLRKALNERRRWSA